MVSTVHVIGRSSSGGLGFGGNAPDPRKQDCRASDNAERRQAIGTKRTDVTEELIASMQEAAAIVRGEAEPARVHLPPGSIDVRAILGRMGLGRPAFAERFGLAVAAARDWKQGLRRPS